MTDNKKPKKLSVEDFNAIYGLIRDGQKHPAVKYSARTFRGIRD